MRNKITHTIPVTVGDTEHQVAWTFRTLLKLEDEHEITLQNLQDKGTRGLLTFVTVALQEECDKSITAEDVMDSIGLGGIAAINAGIQKVFDGAGVPLTATNGSTPGQSPASTSG